MTRIQTPSVAELGQNQVESNPKNLHYKAKGTKVRYKQRHKF
jgi:hypothetical protein